MLDGIKKVLAMRHFWPLCAVYSGMMIVFFGFYGLWFGPYMVHTYGMSKVEAGTILSAGAFTGVAGMPIAAMISDAIHSRKKVIIGMSFVQMLCIAALVLFPGRLPLPALVALAAAFSFCNGAVGLCFTSCKELFPLSILGAATGCLNTLPPVLGAAGQKIYGAILGGMLENGVNAQSAYGRTTMLYLAVLLCAFAASFFLRETHPSVYTAEEDL